MSSRIQGSSVVKRVIETIRRNTKDTRPGSNGQIIGNWCVRIFSLGCGAGIAYNLEGYPANLLEDYWQEQLKTYHEKELKEKN